MRKVLRNTAERSRINKRVNPHSFRHARASYLANRLTESQLKQYFGWNQSSDMASIYVHLSNKDTEDAIIRANGKERIIEQKPSLLNPKICQRCKEKNESSLTYCGKCGFVLDPKVANISLEQEQKEKSIDIVMSKLMENSSFIEFLEKAIDQLKEKKEI